MRTGVERLALVTGTSSGIGAALARQLLDDGWTVVGISRRTADLTGERYRHVSLDLGDLVTLKDTTERALTPALTDRRWERIGLVNNAAAPGAMLSIEDIDPATFAGVLAVNIVAPVYLMGLVVRIAPLATPLRIVNVSTGAAVQAFPGIGEYASSKAALRMASMTLAAEMTSSERPGGPRANLAVLSYQPGTVDTAMQAAARAPGRQWNRLFVDFHRQGRLVPADAPAREIVGFLKSDGEPAFSERRFGVT